MPRKGIGGHQSAAAATVEWATPPQLLAALGGAAAFDLDPCAALTQPWPCARQSLTLRENGLGRRWSGGVYMNPPYGDALGSWLDRLADHGDGIALVFARTETDAFFETIWPQASAVLFLRGRLTFHFAAPYTDKAGRSYAVGQRAPHNSGGPSLLIAYGDRQAERLARCGLPGFFSELKHGRMLP